MTSTEYGIFNDDGLLEGGYTEDDAASALETVYANEPFGFFTDVCPDHPRQPRDACAYYHENDEDEDADA